MHRRHRCRLHPGLLRQEVVRVRLSQARSAQHENIKLNRHDLTQREKDLKAMTNFYIVRYCHKSEFRVTILKKQDYIFIAFTSCLSSLLFNSFDVSVAFLSLLSDHFVFPWR